MVTYAGQTRFPETPAADRDFFSGAGLAGDVPVWISCRTRPDSATAVSATARLMATATKVANSESWIRNR